MNSIWHDTSKVIVAAFTVSNDSIRMTSKLNEEAKMLFLKQSELEEKRLRRFPAVLIGRLATNKDFAGKGIGSAVMSFIKLWFRTENKTGCRFIIVDAYNCDATLHYSWTCKLSTRMLDPHFSQMRNRNKCQAEI